MQRARDVIQTFGQRGNIESLDVRRRVQHEIHLDAAAVAKFIALAEAFGDDEDVAEQNGRVETEPANRLKRHLGGEFGCLDELEKGIFLFQLAVFWQCATSLAHEPDRRTVHGAAMAGIEKPLAIRQRARGGSGF